MWKKWQTSMYQIGLCQFHWESWPKATKLTISLITIHHYHVNINSCICLPHGSWYRAYHTIQRTSLHCTKTPLYIIPCNTEHKTVYCPYFYGDGWTSNVLSRGGWTAHVLSSIRHSSISYMVSMMEWRMMGFTADVQSLEGSE